MRRSTTLREANDDLARRRDFLDRHLSEIAQRILTVAEAAYSAAILQGEMIGIRPATAGPTDQAVDQARLLFRLQHSWSVYKHFWRKHEMASPKCGHCGATTFDSKTHIHEEIPTLYICCSGCGAVVGIVNKIKP